MYTENWLKKQRRKEINRIRAEIEKIEAEIQQRKKIKKQNINEITERLRKLHDKYSSAKNSAAGEEWEFRQLIIELEQKRFEERNQYWNDIKELREKKREKEREIREIEDTPIQDLL